MSAPAPSRAARKAPKSATPDVERELTIPEFAVARGVSYLRAHRTIMALAKADRDAGTLDWLIDHGPGTRKRLNLSRLEAAHPALFSRRLVQRHELDELRDRVADLEESSREARLRENGRAKRLRTVEATVAQLSLALPGYHPSA